MNESNAGMPVARLASSVLAAVAALATALLLQACATGFWKSGDAKPTPPAAANQAAVPAAVGAAAAAAPASAASDAQAIAARFDATPGQPKPFDEVIKGATQQAGFVPIWRKDDKIWLEIPAALVDQPFLLSVNVASSVGERGLYASQMGPSWLAAFRKIGNNQMQLIALNTSYVSSTPAMKTAVEQGFSNSLLGSAAIASAPHPKRKSVLIDAGFLLTDIPGYSTHIEQAFHLPYSLDRGNSFFEKTRVTDDLTTVSARVHFATARLPAPPILPGPVPFSLPLTTPDARSMFVGFVYSLTHLPEHAMPRRLTDPRLGHFFDVVTDLGSDLKANPRLHYVNRWRLEKKDPAAPLSEPTQPIVYWLDKNIPPQYRQSVTEGALEWNKAFEKIGFKNAIVVRQQPDDAEWDNMDSRHASIRWFVGSDVGFAVGPNQSDPRTGEIIDADIAMSDVFGRNSRRFIVEDVGASVAHAAPQSVSNLHSDAAAYCDYTNEAVAEMDFALDLLESRGDIAPDGPEAEAFVQAVVKDTIMHEVGHTLGLKHNFKGSTAVSRAQLQNKAYTEKYGISGSVMDYNGYNLAVHDEKQASLNNNTLGPYDYWAIEYAYKPIAPADEAAELARIASRSTDPQLAYADDSEAGGVGNDGIDPLVNRFDLGDDPLAYYEKRLQLSRELWQRVQDRQPQPGDEAMRQRRILLSGFRQLNRATELVGKYVGGMYTVRDLPGTTQRAAYVPVEPAKQREALQFLATGIFNADSFHFKPEFIANLAPDYNEWDRGGPVSVPAAVLQLQTVAMDRLLSPGTASRLLDLPSYVSGANKSSKLISLAEVYGTLQSAVWSELKTGEEIDRLRRNLQREHLKRVQNLLLHGSASLPPDALSLMRMDAVALQAQLKRASTNGKLSVDSRAHLQDSLSQLTEALRASMLRG